MSICDLQPANADHDFEIPIDVTDLYEPEE